jgi:hypothetical protein
MHILLQDCGMHLFPSRLFLSCNIADVAADPQEHGWFLAVEEIKTPDSKAIGFHFWNSFRSVVVCKYYNTTPFAMHTIPYSPKCLSRLLKRIFFRFSIFRNASDCMESKNYMIVSEYGCLFRANSSRWSRSGDFWQQRGTVASSLGVKPWFLELVFFRFRVPVCKYFQYHAVLHDFFSI